MVLLQDAYRFGNIRNGPKRKKITFRNKTAEDTWGN